MTRRTVSFAWTLAALAAAIVVAVVWFAPARSAFGGAPSCDPARTHASGDFNETIDSGGRTREYLLHVPPSYSGGEAAPLVFLFHGLTNSADWIANYTELPAKADQAGFLLVTPQGLSTPIVPVPHWNVVIAPPVTGEPDDVAFISELLDALQSQLCIDGARVFATGLSNGAEMSVRLACSLSERVAAIAPVAGLYFPPLSLELADFAGCASTRPVPLVAFHGTADTFIPFDGGRGGEPGVIELTFRDIDDEIMPEWAAHNGCTSTPTEEQLTEHVRLVRYGECVQGATVELYVVEGGGHTWPGAQFDPDLGPVTDEINANDLIWEFFESHPLATVQALASPTPTPEPTATPPGPTPTVAALPSTGIAQTSNHHYLAWSLFAAVTVLLLGGVWYTRARSRP